MKKLSNADYSDNQKKIRKAAIYPPYLQLFVFYKKLQSEMGPKLTYKEMYNQFLNMSTFGKNFFFKDVIQEKKCIEWMHDFNYLTTKERYSLTLAPVAIQKTPHQLNSLYNFGEAY